MKKQITISFLVTVSFLFNANISLAQGFSVSGTNTYTNPLANFVGIGITTPAYPLQINGGTDVGTLSSGNNFLVGLNYTDVTAAGVTTNTRHAVFGATTIIADILFVNKVSSTYDYYERMRINRFGRVGIGTAAPDTSALLDVSSTNKGVLIPRIQLVSTTDAVTITLPATSLLVYNILGGGLTPAGYWYNAGSSISPNWVQLISTATSASWLLAGNSISSGDFIGTTNAQDFIIKTNNTEKMRVLSGGNVGIGTAAPTSLLDVFGGELRIRMNASSAVLRFYDNIQNSSIQTNSGNIGIFTTTNERIRIQHSTGNVGIGTTSPGRLLEVNGQMKTTNDNPEKPFAGSWTGYSDQRLKQNIAPFEDGLSILRQVNPVTFKSNGIGNLSSTETHIGVIAQDLKPVAPYCVFTGAGRLTVKQSESTNFSGSEIIETLPADSLGEIHTIVSPLTYNYDGLIYVMINSIKQLDSTNTELLKKDSILTKNDSVKDAEIQALQNLTTLYDTKFQQMQNRINQLDSMINSCCILGSTKSMQLNSDSQVSDTQIINSKDVELVNRQVVVLFQNSPNPFKEQTTIEYYLPDNVQRAQIIFLEQSGKLIKTVDLTEKGKGVLNVFANDLSNGTYLYSIIVDGQTIETKKMVKTK